MVTITIPLPPVTKKNSQRIILKRFGGKQYPSILPSKAYEAYAEQCCVYLMGKALAIDTPVNVMATYYMKTKGKVDLINLHSALHDVLVKYQVIMDDNSSIVVSTDGSRVLYDKKNPRTEIHITEVAQ